MTMKMLISQQGRKHIINEESDLQTDEGVIKKEDIAKAKEGDVIKNHKGVPYSVMTPGFNDYFETMKRGPQIITLKDCGVISAYTGLSSGMRVLDAGMGGGALTSYLANIVKPKGRVYAYEIREEHLKIGRKNLERMGLIDYVTIKNLDVYEQIDEKNLDLITLDLPEPQKALNNAKKALKLGGYLIAYVPTVTQLSAFCESLQTAEMTLIKAIEVIERPWKVKGKAVRPENVILGHTGFIIITRKMCE